VTIVSLVPNPIIGYLTRLPNMSDTFIFSQFSSIDAITSDIAHSVSSVQVTVGLLINALTYRKTRKEIKGRVTDESKKG
jgi:hypothetical protein